MRRALALLLLAPGCADEAPALAPTEPPVVEDGVPVDKGKADGASGSLVYSSASGVEGLDGKLTSLDPPLRAVGVGDYTPQMYLRPLSCLGYYGPIGPYGPLGLLGPVGDSIFDVSTWVTATDWHLWAYQFEQNEGPLGPDGPLGSQGPLNVELWGKLGADAAEATLADAAFADDFVVHLQPGGVFGALGQVGPLGALGPLGPLGPVGAHGYLADDDGQYVDEACDGVCRSVKVEWTAGGEAREWPLFEHYPAKVAQALPDNDTSFMVSGDVEEGAPEHFDFTSDSSQWITVALIPEYARFTPPEAMTILSTASLIGYRAPITLPIYPFVYSHRANFDDLDLSLRVTDGEGKALGVLTSDSADVVDWIQVFVPAGARIDAEVRAYRSWWQPWRTVPVGYRLMVVGATAHVQTAPFFGDHVRSSVLSE